MAYKFLKAEWEDGVYLRYYWCDVTKTMKIRNTTDVSSILKANKAQQALSIDSHYGKEMMHHVAEIPNSIVVIWKKKYNIDLMSGDPDMKKRARRLLDDPEWKYLKSTVRKLSRVSRRT